MTMPLGSKLAAAAFAAALSAVIVTAGIEPVPWRPASLVTSNLVMLGGRPFVALSDLAKALAGTGHYDPVRLRYEIRPGPNGVLVVNPGAFSALALAPGALRTLPADHRNPVNLAIGSAEVTIPASEGATLRPGEAALSLDFLARLLGGQARFDSSKGFWELPAGGPSTPLRFR
ncbi:MAG TPA: hypothetical protein VMT19_12135 [Thermoanaerobaculaceae bacterium]|nr:hypothetical protein [Thermoanaerobaculaceae bacterium]